MAHLSCQPKGRHPNSRFGLQALPLVLQRYLHLHHLLIRLPLNLPLERFQPLQLVPQQAILQRLLGFQSFLVQ